MSRSFNRSLAYLLKQRSQLHSDVVAMLQSLRSKVSRWGWGRTLFAGFMSCLRTYAGIHIYRVNLRPLVPRSAAPVQLPAGISLSIVPPPKLLDAANDPELDMESGFVRGALARGDVAFGAVDGDHLIAYVWRPFGAAPDADGLWVKVDPPYHYAYKAFTLPAYRGKRIHIALSHLSDDYFLERGYTAEVGFSEISNFPGIAAADFLGRKRVGFAGYVQWFGRAIPFRTAGVKRIGFELFEPQPSDDRLFRYRRV